MKILAIDIETAPNLAYVWGMWDQNVGLDQLVDSGEILCWAAKWLGTDENHFHANWTGSHKKMIKEAHKLLDEADAVLHFNGRRFDVPWLNREFIEQGLNPPSPYKQIDLLETCRKQFRFPSNKLAYVTERLGLEGKIRIEDGFKLWLKVLDKDPEAQARMQEYNIRDVTELEELYEVLKPWIKGHPSYAAFTGENVCPKCGSDNLKKRGFAYTPQSKFQKMLCLDCGSWARFTVGGERAHIVQVAD